MELNHREVAIVVWVTIALALMLRRDQVRKSALSVVRHLLVRSIVIFTGLMVTYVTICVLLLKWLGWWSANNLKATALWLVGFAFVALMNFERINADRKYFGKTVRDILGATAAFAFIAEYDVFSLPVELILVPTLFALSLIAALAERDAKLAGVARLAGKLLVVAGVMIVANSLYGIYSRFDQFATSETLREFVAPILLSLLYLPFIFVVNVVASYEVAGTRLSFAINDEAVRKRALRKSVRAFGIRLGSLRKWLKHVATFRPKTDSEVTESIHEIKELVERERRPSIVPPVSGWPPHRAVSFLQDAGLATGDYHRSHDGWYASSPSVRVSNTLFGNNVAYYVEGDESAALRLRLVLSVGDADDAKSSEERFLEIAFLLIGASLRGTRGPATSVELKADGEPIVILGRTLRMLRKEWPSRPRGGYDVVLTIEAQNPSNSAETELVGSPRTFPRRRAGRVA